MMMLKKKSPPEQPKFGGNFWLACARIENVAFCRFPSSTLPTSAQGLSRIRLLGVCYVPFKLSLRNSLWHHFLHYCSTSRLSRSQKYHIYSHQPLTPIAFTLDLNHTLVFFSWSLVSLILVLLITGVYDFPSTNFL
jgi:hypothetical protein